MNIEQHIYNFVRVPIRNNIWRPLDKALQRSIIETDLAQLFLESSDHIDDTVSDSLRVNLESEMIEYEYK